MPNTPPEIPVIHFPTPNKADRVLVETWDTLRANQNPIDPGTPHPDLTHFPGYVFVQQAAIEGVYDYVHRIWVNDRGPQDFYNSSIGYSGESNAHPIYPRSYIVRRSTYAPLTKLQPFTGVTEIVVTAGGSDYAVVPTISFTGGGGSGAAAFAVIFRGAIVAIIPTAEGTGYTSAPTVVITPASGGTGSTATAKIQPATALLVEEKAVRMEGDPLESLYLKVTRLYETLPGPLLPDSHTDPLLGTIQRTRQAVVNTNQQASLSATGKTTYEARDGSAIVSWQIIETSGSGLGGGFTGYPISTEDLWDREKGPFERVTQVVVATGSEAATFVVTGSLATMTEYMPLDGYQPYLLKKIIERFAYPTPILRDDEFAEEESEKTRKTQLVDDITSPGTLSVSGGTATDISYQPYNSVLRRKVTTTWPVPGATRTFNIVGRRGFTGSLARTRVGVATTPTTQTELIDVERVPEGKDRVREDVITYAAGGSPLVRGKFNRFTGFDTVSDTYVAATTVPILTTSGSYKIQALVQEKEKQARLLETIIATGIAIDTIEKVDEGIPGSRATRTIQLVTAASSHPSDTSTAVYERLEFEEHPLLRILRTMTYAIPATFTEYVDHGMAYPTLFTSYYSDNIQGTTVIERGGFSVVVPHLVTHSFSTTGPTAVAPYQIIENNLTLFSIHASGLMDAGTAERIVNGVTFSQPYDASIPSRTTYNGLIGSAITVSGGSEIYRAGIFHTKTISVILQ